MKKPYVVLIVLVAVLLSSLSTYLITSSLNDQRHVRDMTAATDMQHKADQTQLGNDLTKLRSCVHKSITPNDQTSCFRKMQAGVLPELSIEDMNELPDLY